MRVFKILNLITCEYISVAVYDTKHYTSSFQSREEALDALAFYIEMYENFYAQIGKHFNKKQNFPMREDFEIIEIAANEI